MAVSEQQQHGWSAKLKSEYLEVDELVLKAFKERDSNGRDIILGKEGYKEGKHTFFFKWNTEVTGRLSIGISVEDGLDFHSATDKKGFGKLSYVWDFDKKIIITNQTMTEDFPMEKFKLGTGGDVEVIIAVDFDVKKVSFYQLLEHTCVFLYDAKTDIESSGKKWHIAACLEKAYGEVIMKYIGKFDLPDSENPLGKSSMAFSYVSAINVEIKKHATQARRVRREIDCGTVLSHRPLKNMEMFEIQIEKMNEQRQRALHFGLVALGPVEFQYPDKMFGYNGSMTWMYSGNKVYFQDEEVTEINANLDKIKPFERVGVRINDDLVEFFFSGYRQAAISLMDTKQPLYGFVEIHGRVEEISLVTEYASPLTSEQMIEGLQNTLNTLNASRDDLYFILQVLENRLNEPLTRMDLRMKELIGKKLAHLKFATSFVPFLKLKISTPGHKQEKLQESIQRSIMNICMGYAKTCPEFAKSVCDAGIIEVGVQLLLEETETELNQVEIIWQLFYHCARPKDVISHFGKEKFMKTVSHVLEDPRYRDRHLLHFMAVSTAARLFYKEEKEILKLQKANCEYAMVEFKAACKAEKELTLATWTVTGLSEDIEYLCKIPENKEMFFQVGFIEELLTVPAWGQFKQRASTLKAIRAIISETNIKEIQRAGRLLRKMQQLKSQDHHSYVKKIADSIIDILQSGKPSESEVEIEDVPNQNQITIEESSEIPKHLSEKSPREDGEAHKASQKLYPNVPSSKEKEETLKENAERAPTPKKLITPERSVTPEMLTAKDSDEDLGDNGSSSGFTDSEDETPSLKEAGILAGSPVHSAAVIQGPAGSSNIEKEFESLKPDQDQELLSFDDIDVQPGKQVFQQQKAFELLDVDTEEAFSSSFTKAQSALDDLLGLDIAPAAGLSEHAAATEITNMGKVGISLDPLTDTDQREELNLSEKASQDFKLAQIDDLFGLQPDEALAGPTPLMETIPPKPKTFDEMWNLSLGALGKDNPRSSKDESG